jgi:two-component system chemotaxis response regulator CheY
MENLAAKSILIVDDSPTMRQMVCFTLKTEGYNVMEAENGKAAVEIMNDYKFDLIITDLNMPYLDGIKLIKHARANPLYKFIPIIMLTTESQFEKKIEGKCAGATGWITKPFKTEQLITVVKRVLY